MNTVAVFKSDTNSHAVTKFPPLNSQSWFSQHKRKKNRKASISGFDLQEGSFLKKCFLLFGHPRLTFNSMLPLETLRCSIGLIVSVFLWYGPSAVLYEYWKV